MNTGNFKLKPDEDGLTVYRKCKVSAQDVLNKPEAVTGSGLAQTTAAAIRSLYSGSGDPLQLDVVAVDDEDDPGHAEIRGPEPGKLKKAASKALRDAFQWERRPDT